MDHNSGTDDEIQSEVALRRKAEDFTDLVEDDTELQIAQEVAAIEAVSNLGEQIENEWEARISFTTAQWEESDRTPHRLLLIQYQILTKHSAAAEFCAGAWNALDDFRPSESYKENSRRLAELHRHTNDKNVAFTKFKENVGRTQVHYAAEYLRALVESDECMGLNDSLHAAKEAAESQTDCELHDLEMWRDYAEWEQEEFFGRHLFNEELAYVQRRSRKDE